MMLVLIVGITGDFGQRLAREALARGLWVRGLGRNPAKLNDDISARLESFITSDSIYDIPALDRGVSGVDAVVCAYQATPLLWLDGSLLLLRAAERAQIKIFVASSWNSDWTNLSYGDFELYDSMIAFRDTVEKTSPIRPVYVINGFFADYLFVSVPGGPFEDDGYSMKVHYWGDMLDVRFPWVFEDDSACWTIDLILQDENVRDGQGGIFKFIGGTNSLKDHIKTYEGVTGAMVECVCDGNREDLEEAVQLARKEKGKSRWMEYMWLAWCRIALKGLWEIHGDTTPPKGGRASATVVEHFMKRFSQ